MDERKGETGLWVRVGRGSKEGGRVILVAWGKSNGELMCSFGAAVGEVGGCRCGRGYLEPSVGPARNVHTAAKPLCHHAVDLSDLHSRAHMCTRVHTHRHTYTKRETDREREGGRE